MSSSYLAVLLRYVCVFAYLFVHVNADFVIIVRLFCPTPGCPRAHSSFPALPINSHLSSTHRSKELRPVLTSIWAKILSVDTEVGLIYIYWQSFTGKLDVLIALLVCQCKRDLMKPPAATSSKPSGPAPEKVSNVPGLIGGCVYVCVCMYVFECGIEMAHGTFTFIEDETSVGMALVTCLGGLFSVIAQSIEVKIKVNGEYKVTKVHSHFDHQLNHSDGSVMIKLPDLFSEEKRDLLLSFDLPISPVSNESVSIATAAISYLDPTCKSTAAAVVVSGVDFLLTRPAEIQEQQTINVVLDVHRNRIRATEAIKEAVSKGEAGQYPQACDILKTTIDMIEKSASRSDPLCGHLLTDLRECLDRFSNQESFQSGGYAFARSTSIQHQQQRGTYSSPERNVYSNSTQTNQQSNYVRSSFSPSKDSATTSRRGN